MKNIIILLTIGCLPAFAQDSKFESAMLKGKEMIAGAESYSLAFNYFERIAQKEEGEWLPKYYQAQVLAFQANNDTIASEKEERLNAALKIISEARKLEKNAELITLEGFVQMLRLTIDPASRGQSLSPTIFGLYQEALAMDPDNPRALLFMGQMQLGTAQFFGKGTEDACKYINKAYNIFEQMDETPSVYPDWGKGSAEAALATCNQ